MTMLSHKMQQFAMKNLGLWQHFAKYTPMGKVQLDTWNGRLYKMMRVAKL
jgi:hypothetical protein